MATLLAPSEIFPVEDAEALRKATKGWGTDEEAIINILGHRNATQRLQIRQAYHDLYQEDLIKRLESELSGHFERAMYRWVLDPFDRDAVLANVAIRKGSGNPEAIIEISCARSSEELLAVRRAYMARYKRSLEEDVAAHTSGDIRRILVSLVTAFRYEGDEINLRVANSEAEILRVAVKEGVYSHDEVLRVLSTRSKSQLMATFNCYRDGNNGISITKELLSDSGNELAMVLHTTIRCLNDPTKYFEKVVREALKRYGTDEDGLTRVIVTRAEKDLMGIKERYYKKNNISLDHAVAKEISGDYKAFLLALMGYLE
ncbi:PREDICTED: annexin-like protein RJ4 isoform X1 [Tarenaya hassleriana]|uniref:annexin-like protein RJ4 isoform X1 n=1 Tax=Tarenaya hassleriana TaxID=28532 RepID=UPI00053C8D75|nr:PREDICTED: annexin-like protein RJ4 isoform X1 [Tarenaya hassleriana]